MPPAVAALTRFREHAHAQAAFVVDHLGRLCAFDSQPDLPPATLADLTARQVTRAAAVVQRFHDHAADSTWEVDSGRSIYVTPLSPELAVVLLLQTSVVHAGTLGRASSAAREELLSALTATTQQE